MKQRRVHILSAVNAANVSKTGSTYTIRDVCGAVDNIVMNGKLYPADQLAAGVKSLEGKLAPAGHPKNAAGQYISAANGEALQAFYMGAICRNARHESGRTATDIVVNEAQARAHPKGVKLIERLDAAISGENVDPIHVSTGLMCSEVVANGESMGKPYKSIVTNIDYDHLAILLDEQGAATPEQRVGMFLNQAGESEEVEEVTVNVSAEDKRYTGLTGWIRKLLGNSDLSFDQITDGLRALLPKDAWVREVYPRYFIWVDYVTDKLYQQDYSIGSDGSLAFTSDPIEVTRKVEYEPIAPITNHEKEDSVKTHILAALNQAGISVAGLDDTQLLSAYNALQAKPLQDSLTAANSKLAEIEIKANAAKDAELTEIATKLAVNSSLKPEDFKAMGLERCKELAAVGKAAPVVVGNAGKPADEFSGYSLNSLNKEAK